MTAGRKVNSKSQNWCTPINYVRAVRKVFGGKVHLDPCSNKHSFVNAEVKFMLPQKNGLIEKWDYPTIYVNPPYGADRERKTTIKNWLAKCAEAYETYGSEVIALVPVAPNTRHWKDYVFGKARAICFLYDTRLRFLENGNGGGKGAPMACAMIYWGNNFKIFFDVFIEYGAVVDIFNLKHHTIGIKNKENNISLGTNLSASTIPPTAYAPKPAIETYLKRSRQAFDS